MDKQDQTNNKLRESFENFLPDERPPDIIWENVVNNLNKTGTSAFIKEDNKIRDSFESEFQGEVPENLWDNVADRLEIESAWKKVQKSLNRRTKWRYWQEKGIQLGIVALAILWLRGCELNDIMTSQPEIYTSDYPVEVKENTNNFLSNTNKPHPNKNLHSTSSEKTNPIPKLNIIPRNNKSSSEYDSVTPLSVPNASTIPQKQVNTIQKQKKRHVETINIPTLNSKNNTNSFSNQNIKKNSGNKDLTQEKTRIINPYLVNLEYTHNKNTKNAPTPELETNNPDFSEKKSIAITKVASITGSAITVNDSSIHSIQSLFIENITPAHHPHLHFELGLTGRIGTSLLLGNATYKAMETTSMLITKIRPASSFGGMLSCYFTHNDAIVLGLYPFVATQQYFGGYSQEGRFYQKEIKLTYIDFTFGYQRTLFHYNNFGKVPSSVYARLDYGLSYLSKGEEIINGDVVETGNSYRKINHSLGFSLGNRHQIKRFVIEYGINTSIGIYSVLNPNQANHLMKASNLMNVGGFLGLKIAI